MNNKVIAGGISILTSPITCTTTRPDAEAPFKENHKSVAWEVTIVGRTDNRAEDVYGDVNTFETGLVLNSPAGHHLEVIEHPALHKAGYMLIGGPIIIDPENTEELILPLYKYRESEDIELPFRAALLVLRATEYAPVLSVAIKKKSRRTPQYEDEYEEPVPKPAARVGAKKGKTTNHMF
jgi:hypothetical protein